MVRIRTEVVMLYIDSLLKTKIHRIITCTTYIVECTMYIVECTMYITKHDHSLKLESLSKFYRDKNKKLHTL